MQPEIIQFRNQPIKIDNFLIGDIGNKKIYAGRVQMEVDVNNIHLRYVELRCDKIFIDRPVITLTLSSQYSAGPNYSVYNVQWSNIENNTQTQFQFWAIGTPLENLKVFCDFNIIGQIK